MIGRPCKPDPDVNWLWRTLLPDMPLPACDLAPTRDASAETVAKGGALSSAPAERSWLRKLWPLRSQSE
jgi:hypothetical protein